MTFREPFNPLERDCSSRQGTHCRLDLRDSFVPYALLKASHAVRGMKRGETLEILLSGADAREDLFRILPASLYCLIETGDEEFGCRAVIRRM